MNKEQSKIDLEANAVKVLDFLSNFGGNGVCAIAVMTGLGVPSTRESLEWLATRGYVSGHHGEFYTTIDGGKYLRNVYDNPNTGIGKGLLRWKDEAITGLTEEKSKASGYKVSRPTEMDNCAIPNPTTEHKRHPSPEDYIRFKQDTEVQTKIIASELGMRVAEFKQLMSQNRIAICKGHDGISHIGVFHVKRRSKSGRQRLQHLCIKCRKTKRRTK